MSLLSPKNSIWLAGFRPFFLLACVLGVVIPGLWGLIFSGNVSLPPGINPMQWHAHEMFYGFGGAVLIGFLLTASKNWVNVRGIHGAALMGLVCLWISERGLIFYSSSDGYLIKHVGLSLFPMASGTYIAWTLIRHRKVDTFKDNYFFLFLLAMFVLSKNLLLSEAYYQEGIAMSLGIFRLAFAVMFERTMPQFMKSTEGVILYRNIFLDYAIKILIAIGVFQSFFPIEISALTLVMASTLMFARWLMWRPPLGFSKFGNGVMYLGYLGLAIHLIFEGLKLAGIWSFGAYSIHIFTFMCMGIVIPSMLIRISKGHTGRKPEFLLIDKIPIYLILIASVFRLLLPLFIRSFYSSWILVSGLLWSSAYLVLIFRIAPFLLNARIDGKTH